MTNLKMVMWCFYALAVAIIVFAFALDDLFYLTIALNAAVAGVFFGALDRIVELLSGILSELRGERAEPAAATGEAGAPDHVEEPTIEKVRADLADLDKRLTAQAGKNRSATD